METAMALFEDLAKGAATPTGLMVGIGAALLMPVLAPAASGVLRPTARAVMRTGIMLYRGTIEPISAAVTDLVTEAQLELATASSGSGAAASGDEQKEQPKSPRHKARGGS